MINQRILAIAATLERLEAKGDTLAAAAWRAHLTIVHRYFFRKNPPIAPVCPNKRRFYR